MLPTLLGAAAQAQTANPEPAKTTTTRSVELRGGYTAGRYSHSDTDYHSSFSLFGSGGSSRPGRPVEHRYDGLLLGADYVQAFRRPSGRTNTVRVGLDVLGAADRLTIGEGRRNTLGLVAAHPHFGFETHKRKLLTRVGAGLLVGRVGYYSRSGSFDLLSTSTVVDTVRAVPALQLEMNWNHWVQYEVGYGANGLLGLANPVYTAGIGTGFGPRSPVAVVFGSTVAKSLDYANRDVEHYYARVTLAPASKPWQANAFVTFGTPEYRRVALQLAYRLPLRTAGSAVREVR